MKTLMGRQRGAAQEHMQQVRGPEDLQENESRPNLEEDGDGGEVVE